jgi:hypothetical protein
MATTITPTNVITEFGSYYIDQGQNMDSLRMRPFEAFGTREAFTNVPTNDTQLRYSDVQVSEILQPYQDTFSAKGSVVFEPVKIDLQQVKIDQQFNPNNLVYSWLGFLTTNKTDRTQWPFTRWMIEVYLLKQLFKDLETKAVYKGEKLAVAVPGTAGAAVDVINGVKKLINTYVTAAKITPIAVGAVPGDPADFCTYVEEFCKGIDELYWEIPIAFNLSNTLALRYREGRKKKYNMYYAQESDLAGVANFNSFSVKGRSSMKGSEKIWGTPMENAVWATKGFENANGFELEKVDRNVKIWTDFHIGLDFLLKDLVFTNDVELA